MKPLLRSSSTSLLNTVQNTNIDKKYVLITGGLGFIGSHTCVELVNNGYDIIIVDNSCNSSMTVKNKIETITGKIVLSFFIDILDKPKLEQIFAKFKIDTVMHFAGLKSVSESIYDPLKYYSNNLRCVFNILELMKIYRCNRFIFSSSATVYGTQAYPVNESAVTGTGITNPYGKTKHVIEELLKDMCKTDSELSVIALRYFNPVGAHPSGLIGEDPKDIPNNLFPVILKACSNDRRLSVFGHDYSTIDGTCVRDFIHVVDLAKGHIAALRYMKTGFDVFNLGTGKGTSVLELVHTFEIVNSITFHIDFVNRRPGDIDIVYADVSKAKDKLGWIATKNINDICTDGYRFYAKNKKN